MQIIFLVAALSCVAAVSIYPSQLPPRPQDKSQFCADPRFACQDLHSAHHCDSVKICIQEVWEKIKLPKANNEVCDICKDMVKQARDQLLSNETQEELKEVFEGSCNLIPVKVLAAECRKLVDDYIPDLVDMLASRMDPQTVCTVAGLCPFGSLRQIIRVQQEQGQISFLIKTKAGLQEKDCHFCKDIMSFIKEVVKSVTEKEFVNAVMKFCIEDLAKPQSECETALTEYIPTIYKFIYNMEAMEACGMVNMCPKSNKTPKSKKIQLDDTLTCEFCENLVQYVRNIISSNTTKEEFRTAFQNFCKELGEIKDECEKMVDEYFDMIYDFILNDLDPKSFCSAIGLCENTFGGMVKMLPAVKITSFQPLVKLFPAEKVHRQDKYGLYKKNPDESNSIEDRSSLQLPEDRLMLPHFILNHDIDCAVCQAVMYFVETEIHKLDVRSKPALKKMLEEVCSTWDEYVGTQCSHFVDKYLDIILDLLMREVKPSEICNLIKVCTDNIKIPEVTGENIKCY